MTEQKLEPWQIYQAAGWKQVYESEESAWSRSIIAQTAKWECDVCKQTTDVLEIDTSDGEYLSFTCCAPCFQNLINKGKK
jgi:hypothetical protein